LMAKKNKFRHAGEEMPTPDGPSIANRGVAPGILTPKRKVSGTWSRHLSKALLSLSLACFVLAGGCTTQHHALLQSGRVPALSPRLLAVYMPWFGDHTHIDVGYSSDDRAVLRKQIQQARHPGISAFVVDWYGPSIPYSDHNFALMQETADENHFQVALL